LVLLALLIIWSLATGYFSSFHADTQLRKSIIWVWGAIGAVKRFLSIVLHELGHSLIAILFGMQMRGISRILF